MFIDQLFFIFKNKNVVEVLINKSKLLTVIRNDQSRDYQRIHFQILSRRYKTSHGSRAPVLTRRSPVAEASIKTTVVSIAGTLCYHRPLVEDRSFLCGRCHGILSTCHLFLKPGFYKASTGIRKCPIGILFRGNGSENKFDDLLARKFFEQERVFIFESTPELEGVSEHWVQLLAQTSDLNGRGEFTMEQF